jgi:hypothetical protein
MRHSARFAPRNGGLGRVFAGAAEGKPFLARDVQEKAFSFGPGPAAG